MKSAGFVFFLLAVGVLASPSSALCASMERGRSPAFEFVAVTDADIAHFGDFPFSRSISATVVQRLVQAGAKAIVYKFFVDERRDGDGQLAAGFSQIPTYLQMNLARVTEGADGLMHASAVGPHTALASVATQTGFVHQREAGMGEFVETQAQIDGRNIASLSLLAAQEIVGEKAVVTSSALGLGARKFSLNARSQAYCPYAHIPVPTAHPFRAVIDGSNGFLARFKDKVVVIGYMASNTPRVALGGEAPLPVHVVFLKQVACLVSTP